jgi:hypothetical protein
MKASYQIHAPVALAQQKSLQCWVGPGARLDAVEKEEILTCPGCNTVRPASNFTD